MKGGDNVQWMRRLKLLSSQTSVVRPYCQRVALKRRGDGMCWIRKAQIQLERAVGKSKLKQAEK